MTLTPAYGRDYTSKAKVMKDWNDGKDFIIQDISSSWDGKYINKQDAEQSLKGQTLMIRYKRLTQVMTVKV